MKKTYIIIIILVIAVGTAIYFFSFIQSDQGKNSNTQATTTNSKTTNQASTNTSAKNTNTQEEATIPSGSVALFYREGLGKVQNRLRTYDINWESSSSVIVRELPELDQMDAIASYTSPSYSKQSKYPYTHDGRLFLLTDWGSEWASDNTRWNLVEYDPIEGKRKGSDVSFNTGNFAVVGDQLYLTTPVTKDSLGGWVKSYGSLEVMSLDKSSDTYAKEVYSFSGYDERGTLYGAGEHLLMVKIDYQSEPNLMNIFKFDTTTNTFQTLHSDLIVDDFSKSHIFPGENTLYILTKKGNIVYINSYPVVGQPKSLIEIDLNNNEEKVYIGEDNGVMAILISSKESDGTKVRELVLYDLLTKEITEMAVGPFSVLASYSRIGVPFLILD